MIVKNVTEIKKNIEEYVQQYSKQMVQDLSEIVKIASISDQKKEVQKALFWVVEKARSLGLKAKTVLQDTVGLVEYGVGDETLGILVHVDVVPAKLEEGWNFAPFSGEITDTHVLGRGTIDDKGPLVAVLYALKIIKELKIESCKKVELIIGTQEEVEWTDMENYKKHFKWPDFGFSPDESFPINNKEKGYADIKILFKEKENQKENCILENMFECLKFEGGTANNSVPDRVSMVCKGDYALMVNAKQKGGFENITLRQSAEGDILIETKGISAHSCFPEKAVNAILEMANFLKNFQFKKDYVNQLIFFLNEKLSCGVNGKDLGLMQESEYYNGEYFGQTYVVPTVLKTKNNALELNINVRIPYTLAKDNIEKAFEKIQGKFNYSFQIEGYIAPTFVDSNKIFLQKMAEAYEAVTGERNEFKCAPALSYASAMPNLVAFGPLFPGEEDLCHEANEKIAILSLVKALKVYLTAIILMITSKESLK